MSEPESRPTLMYLKTTLRYLEVAHVMDRYRRYEVAVCSVQDNVDSFKGKSMTVLRYYSALKCMFTIRLVYKRKKIVKVARVQHPRRLAGRL